MTELALLRIETRSKKKAFLNSCCNAVGITLGIKEERTSLWDHAIVAACGVDRTHSHFDCRGSDGVVAWVFAHDALGMPIDMIRIDALGAAGLIYAAVTGGSLLRRKR